MAVAYLTWKGLKLTAALLAPLDIFSLRDIRQTEPWSRVQAATAARTPTKEHNTLYKSCKVLTFCLLNSIFTRLTTECIR